MSIVGVSRGLSRWNSLQLVIVALLVVLPVCFGKGMWGRKCRSSWTDKENCALNCVSPACYSEVYGEDPLEEGEVDFARGRLYRACLRKELQEKSKAEQ